MRLQKRGRAIVETETKGSDGASSFSQRRFIGRLLCASSALVAGAR